MKFKEGPLTAILSTIGRKTGKKHSVELLAVFYNNRFYFSRRNPNSDWLKNAVANALVKVDVNETTLPGHAFLVKDEELARRISHMKYSDDRAEDSRIVLEVIPDEL